LFVAVPNDIQSLKAKRTEMFRKIGICRPSSKGVYGLPRLITDGSPGEIHLSHFTPNVLESLLRREGFSVLESSTDPYFIGMGVQGIVQEVYYFIHRVFLRLSGLNLYNTIWIVATTRPK
jgi:hypothetical protein